MKKKYNIIFMALVIIFITVSILSVYADSSNSSNSINDTDSTNVTKGVMKSAAVQPMASSVSIQVTPQSVNLGQWDANGVQHTISNAATIRVSPNDGWVGSLFVRASNNFVNDANPASTIELSNFRFQCGLATIFGTNWGDIQTFSTDESEVASYVTFGFSRTCYMRYYITIPAGTEAGTYRTTIIYTAT